MIATTTLPRSPKLIFGSGCLSQLGEEARRLAGVDLGLQEAYLRVDRLFGEASKPENLPMIDANCRAYDSAELQRLGQALLGAA